MRTIDWNLVCFADRQADIAFLLLVVVGGLERRTGLHSQYILACVCHFRLFTPLRLLLPPFRLGVLGFGVMNAYYYYSECAQCFISGCSFGWC